tara:strand:+ start:20756 stop:21400 length:645 start_codon:yes stop_codon:yes gene_type:complete
MIQKILITGSSNGLGEHLALFFAKKGFDIVLHGRNENKLEQIKNQIIDIGQKVESFTCDFSKERDINNFCKIISKINIQILINNAGMHCQNKPLEELSEKYIQDIININLIAPIKLIRGLQHNLKTIININSMSGLEAKKYRSLYASSKWGLKGFSDCYKQEKKSVHVLDVFPTNINTNNLKNNAMNINFVIEKIFEAFVNKQIELILDGRKSK